MRSTDHSVPQIGDLLMNAVPRPASLLQSRRRRRHSPETSNGSSTVGVCKTTLFRVSVCLYLRLLPIRLLVLTKSCFRVLMGPLVRLDDVSRSLRTSCDDCARPHSIMIRLNLARKTTSMTFHRFFWMIGDPFLPATTGKLCIGEIETCPAQT